MTDSENDVKVGETKAFDTNLIYTEPHFKRKSKLNLKYNIYCFIHCNAILSKNKTLIHKNESKSSSVNHSLLMITRLGEFLA